MWGDTDRRIKDLEEDVRRLTKVHYDLHVMVARGFLELGLTWAPPVDGRYKKKEG